MSEISKCCNCGYEWKTGTNGEHSCTRFLKSKLESLLELAKKDFIENRNDTSFDSVIDDLIKAFYEIRKGRNHDWQGKEITDTFLCATYPKMKEHFANSLFWHDNKGRSYLTHVLIAAFVLGMESGIKKGEVQGKIEVLEKMLNKSE